MNARAALTILSLLCVTPLLADVAAGRAAVTRPATPALPEALEVKAVTQRPAVTRHATHVDRPATKAARWAADEWLRTVGWREYYRTGVHRGLRDALRDPTLGRWDRLQGLRAGLDDAHAHATGRRLGRESASDRARVDAERRVESQFTDLSREPRFAPDFRTPLPAIEPVYLDEPQLREVFFDVPAPGLPHDRWALYGMHSPDAFFDAGWAEPARGFDFWCSESTRTASYRRLTPIDQQRFREIFFAVFDDEIAGRSPHVARRAFHAGFADGWGHGSELAYEWSFRRGYREGYNEALDATLAASFATHYPEAFAQSYRAVFDDWSNSPKVAILAMSLTDDSGDGVFEPGERLWVDYELVNYGGRGGTLPLRLVSDVLERNVARNVVVPARDTLRSSRDLQAAVADGVRIDTVRSVELDVDGARRTEPFAVSWPLRLDGFFVERIDAIRGEATVAVRVANRSSATARGRLTLTRGDGGTSERVPLTIQPRGVETQQFTLRDVDAIELLAGRLDVRAEVSRQDRPYENRRWRLPNVADDLASDELLRVTLAASNGELRLSAVQQAELRGLLLDRLRVDWKASVRQRGNPYKRDYKNVTTSTALGALVEATDLRGARNSPVFAGLRADVLELTRDLPGVHPFLRKYTKRLARRLPA